MKSLGLKASTVWTWHNRTSIILMCGPQPARLLLASFIRVLNGILSLGRPGFKSPFCQATQGTDGLSSVAILQSNIDWITVSL